MRFLLGILLGFVGGVGWGVLVLGKGKGWGLYTTCYCTASGKWVL